MYVRMYVLKKPLSEAKCGTGRSSSATAASSNSKQLQRGGSSSSSSCGSSFRAGMQLRQLSGCYDRVPHGGPPPPVHQARRLLACFLLAGT